MVPASKLSLPDARDGVLPVPLPVDALCEILLRLPAKVLCRLRTVCRPWRALLSDPHFIAAHAARHGPLIVLGYDSARYNPAYRNEGIICDIMDVSGHIVKRVHGELIGRVMSVQLDLVCAMRGFKERYVLINPATVGVCALPEGFAEEHVVPKRRHLGCYKAFTAFGKVVSTGEIKVLRLLDNSDDRHPVQLCEIVTVDGSNHARWRRKKAPPEILRLEDPWTSVVMDGTVYILSYEPDHIASFDLLTEDWRQPLRGPLSYLWDDNAEVWKNNGHWFKFSMVTLSGCLVVVHAERAYMDLWFLTDFKKGLWVKQYSIQNSALPAGYGQYTACPLLVLEDGRIILIYAGYKGLIRTYNPRTKTFTNMAEVGRCVSAGLYNGSLLNLAASAS
ncbi:hypothetical protein ACP70R_023383 [Stipagrostis hirtigluma subsp. patula]